MPKPDDLQMLVAAPVLIEDHYITVVEDADGKRGIIRLDRDFTDVSRDQVIEQIKKYEIAIRMTRRVLAFYDEALPVPTPEESEKSWRWLCLACLDDGHGLPPPKCLNCGSVDRWYVSGQHAADPRSMKDIFRSNKLALSIKKVDRGGLQQ